MRTAWLCGFLALGLVGGCAAKKTEPSSSVDLRVALEAGAGAADDALAPQRVEAHHVEHGWVEVPVLAVDDIAERAQKGLRVRVARGSLPAGRYDRVRLVFDRPLTWQGPSGGSADAVQERTWHATSETQVPTPFCVEAGAVDLVLAVHPPVAVDETPDPTLVVQALPEDLCRAEVADGAGAARGVAGPGGAR